MDSGDGVLRVLVVDDSEGCRQAVADAVRAFGHEIVGEAVDGVAAVVAALELRPDVVVMDWQMPKMDGMSATAAIRDRRPAIAVVAHSASSDEEVVGAFMRAGAHAFVNKGDVGELREALRGCCDRSGRAR